MQSLEAACEEGERSAKTLKLNRSSLPLLRPQGTSPVASTSSEFIENPYFQTPFDLFAKLEELREEILAESKDSNCSPLLLERLVKKEKLNTLILNLYPGNKGYSLAMRTLQRSDPNFSDDTANMIETKQWPYEDDDLLRYIDNEELPSYIVEVLEPQFSYLFYSGCIIIEVRDYRQAYPHFKCNVHHVLLRPTLKSFMADINNIAEDRPHWSNDEKDELESQILLANEPTLCLDPDNSICQKVAEINNKRYMWNTHKFRRMARKFSQVTVNRKRKLDQFTHRYGLELFDFINRNKTKPKSSTLNQKSRRKEEVSKVVPIPHLEAPPLSPPSQGVAINEFKTYQRPKETGDCLPQLIEEYVLETDMPSKDKDKPRVYHIKLSILQRPSNSEYLGELYLDRDHKKNEQNGVACRFSLGSRANANRYIHQFTEIFTESGRKSVRIRYGLSPGYKERATAQAQQLQAQNSPQPNLAQEHFNQLNHTLNQARSSPLGNGMVQNNLNVPALGQGESAATVSQFKEITNEELEINALATELMNFDQQFQAAKLINSARQFQAAANAKQQQQLKLLSKNATIINHLNNNSTTNINCEMNAVVMNTINNTQFQALNQKVLSRKVTVSNVTSARFLNHSNLIALSNRLGMDNSQQQQQHQPQTITLASVNSGASYANFAVPVKQQVQIGERENALSALLVGTPAANRPGIVASNTNSLLVEKLGADSAGAHVQTHFVQSPKGPGQQFVVQPKANAVLSPISSPPGHSSQGLINSSQVLNLAQMQGLQNLQVHLSSFTQQLISVSSTGNMQGHTSNLIVSLPVATPTQTSNATLTAENGSNNVAQTVILANASAPSLAQLMTTGMKGLNQQGRNLCPGAQATPQQFQMVSPLQRPQQRVQQLGAQPNLSSRTPVTIKMASPNANVSQVTLPTNQSITNQLQKQAQLQQCQPIYLNQVSVLGKIIKRSNTSDAQ